MAEREVAAKEATHGSAPVTTDAPKEPTTHSAAGMVAIERMVGLDPASKLKHILHKLQPSFQPPSKVRKYGGEMVHNKVTQPGRTHTASLDARVSHATSADDHFEQEFAQQTQALLAWVKAQDDATLTSVLSTLSDSDLGVFMQVTDLQARGRVVLALPNKQLARVPRLGFTSFDWALSTPYELARLDKLLRDPTTSPSVRYAILTAQSQRLLDALSIDTPKTVTVESFTPDNAEGQLIDMQFFEAASGSLSNCQRAFQTLDVPTRQRLVTDSLADTSLGVPNLLTLACAFDDAQLIAFSKRIDAMLPTTPDSLDYLYIAADFAPAVSKVLGHLSPTSRTMLSEALLNMSPDLAKALGLTHASPAATSAVAHAASSVLHATDKIVAPEIHEDHGHLDDGRGNLDNSKRRKPTPGDYAEKAKWIGILEAAEIAEPSWTDALRTYHHFLVDNNGADLPFSYDKYAHDDSAGAATVQQALDDCRDSAVTHSDADGGVSEHFLMESGVIGVGGGSKGYPYPATENWQKAIGAHEIWLEADVTVTVVNGQRTFNLAMTLHAQDRYNFNPGASDLGSATPDDDNGRFEVSGLGKEFLSKSTLRRGIQFTVPAVVIAQPPAKKPALAKKAMTPVV